MYDVAVLPPYSDRPPEHGEWPVRVALMKSLTYALPNYHTKEGTHFYGLSFKYLSLLVLVLQNSTLVLMMRYSRIVTTPDQTMYLASTAVFFAECAKVVASLTMLYYEKQHFQKFLRVVWSEILGRPGEILLLVIPSGLYALQNNLLYLALSNLEAATFQVTYQMKIFSTALFSVILLGRSLNSNKWFALLLLMVGVTLAQVQPTNPKKPAFDLKTLPLPEDEFEKTSASTSSVLERTASEYIIENSTKDDGEDVSIDHHHQSPMIGFTAVFASCISSGFAGCYFEKILKSSDSSMWVRNIQLGISGSLFSFLAIFLNDRQRIQEDGFLQGYNWLTCIVIMNQALGGLLVAIVVKYADNILKGFATSISIIISSIVSCFLFDFQPSIHFIVGTLLVMSSTFLYSRPDRKPLKAAAA